MSEFMKEIYNFDVARASAIFMVFACHFLMFSGISSSIGGMLGGAGNCMFFTLSALLYGIKWEKTNRHPFNRQWFFTRYKRIAPSLYLFLIILIISFFLFSVPFRLIDGLFNFIFLGWLFKLPGNGHLWFLTVMWICYAIFYAISRIGIGKWNNQTLWSYLLLLTIVVVISVEYFNYPGHAFPMFLLSSYAFTNASHILEKIKSLSLKVSYWQFIVITAFVFFIFSYFNVYQIYRPLSYFLYIAEGLSIMTFILNVDFKRKNTFVVWLSSISFEIYLVHHGFCQGEFSVLNSTHLFWSLFLLLLVSTLSACLLKRIAGKISTCLL